MSWEGGPSWTWAGAQVKSGTAVSVSDCPSALGASFYPMAAADPGSSWISEEMRVCPRGTQKSPDGPQSHCEPWAQPRGPAVARGRSTLARPACAPDPCESLGLGQARRGRGEMTSSEEGRLGRRGPRSPRKEVFCGGLAEQHSNCTRQHRGAPSLPEATVGVRRLVQPVTQAPGLVSGPRT